MDRRLVAVCRKVILIEDFSITCSVRDGETQNQLFMDGLSKARAGQSPHNYDKALAFDFVPWPFNGLWTSTKFDHLAGLFRGAAFAMGIGDLTWGGHWTSILDKPHIELKDWKHEYSGR
jgi:peptidoglycan L-alanyl-D-glutamate endopeptidase CwlK